MGFLDFLSKHKKELAIRPQHSKNKGLEENTTPPAVLSPPESNQQAMARIAEIKQGKNDAVAIGAHLLKAATEYWQSMSANFQVKLSENEIKMVIGLLGNKCLIASGTHCGKTTAIGLAILTRYIILGDSKQIWVVPEGHLTQLMTGQDHAILRDFLGFFGVELLDSRRILGINHLTLAHKYPNTIPVFEQFLPDAYQLRDYWRGIDVVYLDNVFVVHNDFNRFGPVCTILAVTDEQNARLLSSKMGSAKWESVF